MPVITVVCGLLLTLVGVGGYANAWASHSGEPQDVTQAAAGEPDTGHASSHPKFITALIPAFAGLPLIVLGVVAMNEKYLKHAMHAAAVLGLLGFLLPGFMAGRKLLAASGGEPVNPASLTAQLLMAGICAVFVGFCVNSFVAARRRRAARGA